MEKPFDLKDLVAKLQANGLPVAEEMAKLIVNDVLTWVEESVVATPGKYDDFAIPVIETVKPFIMKELDKIDGK